MIIHKNFVGGNIKVVLQNDNDVYLENELRTTTSDWFYWAFCVEGAQGKEVTFHFQQNRLGYYGPAISYDLKSWRFLQKYEENEFTYTFNQDETKVYFAHSMLYHPDRFFEFAENRGLQIQEFCKSKKGRSVPCVTFGEGKRKILLTARHHACESTGNYQLEGVMSELLDNPILDTKFFVVPFVDMDGVVDGDQGKNRAPYDHNRDYDPTIPAIYPETAKIREYVDKNGCNYAFDFHSPWHKGSTNDYVFIVQKSIEKLDRLNAFAEIFEEETKDCKLRYYHKNDYPFMVNWNQPAPTSTSYVLPRKENELAFSLETTYFGVNDSKVSQENMLEQGKCFAKALKRYIAEKEGKISLIK